ncbi:transposase [Desulfosarcina widdelii]|uniref:Transposase n=1 Tax=Desulfosarcina widdelii TaxID=947919 RepID=A0A5K7YYH7_9BACT|nr:Mu transposase C-terminal domain-containing protein [Desulfosarcina widdelii]BBO74436.1 transposase [Desulfosarcina widdelii]
MQAITAKEISGLLCVTVRAVNKRAQNEKWRYDLVSGRGGPAKHYRVDNLPEDIRLLYNKERVCNLPETSGSRLPAVAPEKTPVPAMTEKQKEIFSAKTDLLLQYNRTLAAAGHGNKATARENFMLAYNGGLIFQQIYEIVGPVSWKTIEGWKRAVRSGGNLADKRGKAHKGKTLITAQQATIILQVALHPNKLLIAEVIREAKKRMAGLGIDNGHSPNTYRRWIEKFRTHNYDIWCFQRHGKKYWNDNCCYSIERNPELINVGDVLVADGHKLNFEILNPWTGKPTRMQLITFFDMRSNMPCGWEIAPSENTAAISTALRRAILMLGKIPRVVYLDNGKAFKAKYFKGTALETDLEQAGLSGIYSDLGIQTIFAWAYHGQSKTVERFFGTMAEMERHSDTYSGTSIATKPPRMMRGEKLHRKVYEKIMDGKCMTIEMAHCMVANWMDEYARRPQERSKYLKGWAPVDLFEPGRGEGVDPMALTALMWARKDALIRASRISHMGRFYYHNDLYGRHHKVEIRYDLQDPSYIAVYEDGEFICIAYEQEKTHPAAKQLGTAEDVAQLEQQIAIKNHQYKLASGLSKMLLEKEVLPAHRQQLLREGVTPTGPLKIDRETAPKQLTAAEEKRIEQEAAEYFESQEKEPVNVFADLDRMDEPDRYEQLVRLDARGVMIPKQWMAFMRYFEQTPAYRSLEKNDYWEEVRKKEAVIADAM